MRASCFIAASLDNFIARTNHALDWMPAESGENLGYDEFMASVDALVMGRKTYETVLALGVWPYGEKPVYVLTSGALLPGPEGSRVEKMSGDPIAVVAQLDARGVQHAYVDGGITIQRFLRAGLINTLIVTRVPVLIGTGIPLFADTGRDVLLKHVRTRLYPSGRVQSEYEVIERRAAPAVE